MKNCKTYLFDFDGTLVDSMPIYVSSTLGVLDRHGISYGSDIIKTITPLGILGTAQYFIRLGVSGTVEEIIEGMKQDMLAAYQNTIPAKEHVVEVLTKLKEAGYDLNVLTASPHISLDACLKRIGIFDLFSNVWSCDDFATSKANPMIYHQVAEPLGKPVSEILFFDDNYDADFTAKQAGMSVCGVYDASSEEYTEKIRSITDCYIRDFSEILSWI